MDTSTRNHSIIDNAQILLGAAVWAAFAYAIIYGSPFLPGTDVYFHIQISEIMKNHKLILDSFPWTTCSVWNTNFFDKDWLFHVFLIPFLLLGKTTGAKTALITLIFLIAIAWGMLFKTLKCNYIFIALLLTLFCSFYAFIGRLLLLRAHLLSFLLIALALVFIIKRWRIALTIICILYSLSYTGSWQIIPIAILFDLIVFIFNRKSTANEEQTSNETSQRAVSTSIWAILGILIGTLINPYFPNNITGGIIQNIIVLKSSWFGTPGTIIDLGSELYSIFFRQLFTIYLPVIIILLATIYYCINTNKKIKNIYLTIFFGTLSFVYLVLTILTVKFTDYLIPFSVAFAISAWNEKLHSIGKKSLFILFLILFFILSGYYSICTMHKEFIKDKILYTGATKWLNENIQDQKTFSKTFTPQKIIFTAGWDDTPPLFYGAPQFRYLVFLDPNFMYAYSPEKYKLWKRISDGKVLYPAISIYKNFHSNIVFVSKYKRLLFQSLNNSPYAKLKYVGPDNESIFIINIPKAALRKYNLECGGTTPLSLRKASLLAR